jgi:hypothetical protein
MDGGKRGQAFCGAECVARAVPGVNCRGEACFQAANSYTWSCKKEDTFAGFRATRLERTCQCDDTFWRTAEGPIPYASGNHARRLCRRAIPWHVLQSGRGHPPESDVARRELHAFQNGARGRLAVIPLDWNEGLGPVGGTHAPVHLPTPSQAAGEGEPHVPGGDSYDMRVSLGKALLARAIEHLRHEPLMVSLLVAAEPLSSHRCRG